MQNDDIKALEKFLKEKVGDKNDAPPLPGEQPQSSESKGPESPALPEHAGPLIDSSQPDLSTPAALEAFLNDKVGDRKDAPAIADDRPAPMFLHDPQSAAAQKAEVDRIAAAESAPRQESFGGNEVETTQLEELRIIREWIVRIGTLLDEKLNA